MSNATFKHSSPSNKVDFQANSVLHIQVPNPANLHEQLWAGPLRIGSFHLMDDTTSLKMFSKWFDESYTRTS